MRYKESRVLFCWCSFQKKKQTTDSYSNGFAMLIFQMNLISDRNAIHCSKCFVYDRRNLIAAESVFIGQTIVLCGKGPSFPDHHKQLNESVVFRFLRITSCNGQEIGKISGTFCLTV